MARVTYRSSFAGGNPLREKMSQLQKNQTILMYEVDGVMRPVKTYQETALERYRTSGNNIDLMSLLSSLGYDCPLDSTGLAYVNSALKARRNIDEIFIQSWDAKKRQVVIILATIIEDNLSNYKRDNHNILAIGIRVL